MIDIAEYYGDVDPGIGRQDRLPSAQALDGARGAAWTVSGLKGTLEGFGKKFVETRRRQPGLADRVVFDFVSNRPVDELSMQALQ